MEDVTWLPAANGERQAIRVDSRTTDGAYAVIESAVDADTAVPTHRHRNEEEHFLVLSGHYRIAIGKTVIDAPAGTRPPFRGTPRTAGAMFPTVKADCWSPSCPVVSSSSRI